MYLLQLSVSNYASKITLNTLHNQPWAKHNLVKSQDIAKYKRVKRTPYKREDSHTTKKQMGMRIMK